MRGLKHQLAQQFCPGAQLIVPLGFHCGLIRDPLSKIKTLYLLSINRLLHLNKNKFYKNVGRLLLKSAWLTSAQVTNWVHNLHSFKS